MEAKDKLGMQLFNQSCFKVVRKRVKRAKSRPAFTILRHGLPEYSALSFFETYANFCKTVGYHSPIRRNDFDC